MQNIKFGIRELQRYALRCEIIPTESLWLSIHAPFGRKSRSISENSRKLRLQFTIFNSSAI